MNVPANADQPPSVFEAVVRSRGSLIEWGWLMAPLLLASCAHVERADVRADFQVENDGIHYYDPVQRKRVLLAAPSAPFFITYDPFFTSSRHGKEIVDPRRIAFARTSPEARPEEQDPEGHWGPASEGFRASLRMAKTRFKVGEPVEATVLIRNVSREDSGYDEGNGNPLEFVILDSAGKRFVVLDANRQPLWKKGRGPQGAFAFRLSAMPVYEAARVWPGMQRRYSADLREAGGLVSPGRCLVYVRRKVALRWPADVRRRYLTPEVEVRSSDVVIEFLKEEPDAK